MTSIASRLQVRTAACAIAVVATFTPAAIAQAGPAAPVLPSAPVTELLEQVPMAPVHFSTDTLAQINWWWFGEPNPTPPPRRTVFVVSPLALVPGFLRPLFGWFTSLNFEVCFAGIGVRVGPYGTITGSIGRGC